MESVIIKLNEIGWNISKNANSAIAWIDNGEITKLQMSDTKIVLDNKEPSLCTFTNTLFIELDYPKDQIKKFLMDKNLLPANYNEVEEISKYINCRNEKVV